MAWQPWARRVGWVLLAALLVVGPPQVLPSFYVNLATRVLIFAIRHQNVPARKEMDVIDGPALEGIRLSPQA